MITNPIQLKMINLRLTLIAKNYMDNCISYDTTDDMQQNARYQVFL